MKLYFAGMETTFSGYGIDLKNDDNFFATYFYQKKTDEFLKKYSVDQGHKGIITIDSGAHTFFGYAGLSTMAHHNKKDKKEMPDPYEYFDNYLKWIIENYKKISYYVELDIGAIVGMPTIKKWRRRLIKAGVFDKCIMVMHSSETWKDFQDICKLTTSGYIGLEGLRDKKIHLPYMKMLKYCYERKIKVHGFALTLQEVLKKYPFYSADSTTWTAPLRFGTIVVLDNGMMKQVSPTKKNYVKYNIDTDLVNTSRSKEISGKKLIESMKTQRTYEIFLTKLWKARGVRWQ